MLCKRVCLKEAAGVNHGSVHHRVSRAGLLQTDGRISLREITHQLQLENVLGDKVFVNVFECSWNSP